MAALAFSWRSHALATWRGMGTRSRWAIADAVNLSAFAAVGLLLGQGLPVLVGCAAAWLLVQAFTSAGVLRGVFT